ncbi:MAG: hypothetical protein LBR24_01680, partial [Methanobrevibacter sp.]|nr:hypothetical protein [Methanobrevibacter sp.]
MVAVEILQIIFTFLIIAIIAMVGLLIYYYIKNRKTNEITSEFKEDIYTNHNDNDFSITKDQFSPYNSDSNNDYNTNDGNNDYKTNNVNNDYNDYNDLDSDFGKDFNEHTISFSDNDEDDFKFVAKKWEEPRPVSQAPKNGVASKVFQEPMASSHKDIIENSYDLDTSLSYSHNSIAYDNNDSLLGDDSSFSDNSSLKGEDLSSNDFNHEDNGVYNNLVGSNDFMTNNLNNDVFFEENGLNSEDGEVALTNYQNSLSISNDGKIMNLSVGDTIIFHYNGESYS